MFDRWIEGGLTDVLKNEGIGSIVFSPLAKGLLTEKYLQDIPEDSRAARNEIIHLNKDHITAEKLLRVTKLNNLAQKRGQSLAQMAIAWTLHNDVVTTCLIGASRKEQILGSLQALDHLSFIDTEIIKINDILAD
jgi:L-glyceraldehyde 3-phosphate reductase